MLHRANKAATRERFAAVRRARVTQEAIKHTKHKEHNKHKDADK